MKYSPGIDGLRGVAILCVIAFHAGAPFINGGFFGVDVFFVLSGFLITSLLVREFDASQSISIKNFYAKRALRLGPAFLALMVVFCAVSYTFLGRNQAHRNYVDVLICIAYMTNWARAFLRHAPDYLGHVWSLSVEEQFYLTWPLVLWLLLHTFKQRRTVVIVTASLALLSLAIRIYLSLHGTKWERLYNGLDTRADSLMVGCTLGVILSSGLISDNGRKWLGKLLWVAAPSSAVCLLAFMHFGNVSGLWVYDYGFFAVEILVAILILDIQINHTGILAKMLGQPGMVWIGSISYGLYLWHYPIERTMLAFGYGWTARITVGSLASFVVAAISYYTMEKPILRFKIYFAAAKPSYPVGRPALATTYKENIRYMQTFFMEWLELRSQADHASTDSASP